MEMAKLRKRKATEQLNRRLLDQGTSNEYADPGEHMAENQSRVQAWRRLVRAERGLTILPVCNICDRLVLFYCH